MSMDDALISKGQVITGMMWALVASIVVAAWVVGIAGYHQISALLGFTACATSAAAAVAHVRLYAMIVCSQVRILRGEAQREPEGGLRRI